MTTLPVPQQVASNPPTFGAPGYRYFNEGDGWLGLQPGRLNGLELDEVSRALRLASLLGDARELGPELTAPEAPFDGPSGIAVDREGNVYLADPAADLIWRVEACDGRASPIRALGGSGEEPGRLRVPLGLAADQAGRLHVVDSGNHRLQTIDLHTLQLLGVIGVDDPFAAPAPSDLPGLLDRPTAITADREANLYVVDRGNHRVQKFLPNGSVDVAFWQTLQSQPSVPVDPANVAMMALEDGEALLILDGGRVLAHELDGTFDAETTALWQALPGSVTCVAASQSVLYAGDASGLIHVLSRSGAYVGSVRPFDSPAAIQGMVLSCEGDLLVRQAARSALRLSPKCAFTRCGTFLLGPLDAGPLPARWQRVSGPRGFRSATGHIQLFTLSSDQMDGSDLAHTPALPASCSDPATVDAISPSMGSLVPQDVWRAAPANGLDFLALNQPSRFLWLAGIVQDNGEATSVLPQIRVDFNRESWLRYLPEIYRRSEDTSSFIGPALLMLEGMFDDVSGNIDALVRLFDPMAAADSPPGSGWLDWLAGWMALELQEEWPAELRRKTAAAAFEAHGRRGTVESLLSLIGLYTGARAWITEPGQTASIWSLGASTLGADTMVAFAQANGAVLGATATLGGSHLIDPSEYGAPLFEDFTNRFCVNVYEADLEQSGGLEALRSLIEREKPAHTAFDIRVVGAQMQVGLQSVIGVDTIIGDVPGAFTADGESSLGYETVLPQPPEGSPSLLGQSTRPGGFVLA